MSKMSKTRPNKSRTEILAKRELPIRGFDKRLAPDNQPLSRSKYTPHFGAKQQEKLQNRLVRDAMRQAV